MSQPKRDKYAAVNKTERSWNSEECSNIRHGKIEFGDCPAGFQSCFGPVLLNMFPFLSFARVIYILCHCMLEGRNCFLILILFQGVIDKRMLWVSETLNFGLLNSVEILIDKVAFESGLNAVWHYYMFYGKFTRDDHSNTLYIQLKVFNLTSWDHTRYSVT